MEFTKSVGDACVRHLNRDGWTVRRIPADPPADAYRGDAFIAVHADGNRNPDISGASVGYRNTSGLNLAHGWRDAWIRRGYQGRWNPDNYTDNLHYYYGTGAAISQGNHRACIIECGTITNPEDRAYLIGPGGSDRVAAAIGAALGINVEHVEDDMYSDSDREDAQAAQGRVYAAITRGTDKVEWGPFAGEEDVWLVKHLKTMAADLAELKARPVADVDETELADAMAARGIRGVSAAEIKDMLMSLRLTVDTVGPE